MLLIVLEVDINILNTILKQFYTSKSVVTDKQTLIMFMRYLKSFNFCIISMASINYLGA